MIRREELDRLKKEHVLRETGRMLLELNDAINENPFAGEFRAHILDAPQDAIDDVLLACDNRGWKAERGSGPAVDTIVVTP